MSSQVPARRLVRQQDHRRARTPATEAEDVAEAHKTKNGRRPAFAGSAAADITSARPLAWHFVGSPDRIRTGVTALRGRRPRPLDDGAVRGTDRISTVPAEPRCWRGQRGTDYRLAAGQANRMSQWTARLGRRLRHAGMLIARSAAV